METRIFLVDYVDLKHASIRDRLRIENLGLLVLQAYGRKQALSLIPERVKEQKVNLSIIGEDNDWRTPMNDVVTALRAGFPVMPIIGFSGLPIQGVDIAFRLFDNPNGLFTAILGFAQKGFKIA